MQKKILVIDDEPKFLAMVKDRLTANNYSVSTAPGGKEGIAKAKQEKPHLVLVDIMMPDVDGGEVVRSLKADPGTANIPVIFLTAVVSKQEEQNHHGVVIDETSYPAIAKPFEPAELLKKIAVALGGQ